MTPGRTLSRLARPAALVLAAGFLAACGGDSEEGESTPPTNPAVGVYTLVAELTEAEFEDGADPAKGERVQTMYLSCADEECTNLFQRGEETERSQSLTVELKPSTTPGGFDGTRFTSRPCEAGSEELFEQTVDWTWTRGEDGVLTGTQTYTAEGCDAAGVSTYSATATPLPDQDLPYAATAETTDLIAAFNAYDEALVATRDALNGCLDDSTTTVTLADGDCYETFYQGLSLEVTEIGKAMTALRPAASERCREVIDAIEVDEWSGDFAAVGLAYGKASTKAALRKAYNLEQSGAEFVAEQYALLLSVANLCVNPTEAAAFGENGKTLLDPEQRLIGQIQPN